MKYCIEDFEDNTGIDITNNKKAIRRLRYYYEEVKRFLCISKYATIDIDYLE